jgi:hypothetical protein
MTMSPVKQSSMKLRLDIDAPSFDRAIDHDPLNVEHAEVVTTPVVDLDMAMPIIPLVETRPVARPPAAAAVDESQPFLVIEERRVRDRRQSVRSLTRAAANCKRR